MRETITEHNSTGDVFISTAVIPDFSLYEHHWNRYLHNVGFNFNSQQHKLKGIYFIAVF